jgi:D-3-phosphoglycerate dehydrogenase
LTEETRGLIGPREIEMMKPDAYLLNVARGGIVDETALAEALRTGRLAGAAFDVFAEEPAPRDHPLLGLENVVAVPHLGAATREAQRSVGIEICEAVRDALMRGDFRSAVNAPELAMEGYAELAPLIDLSRRLGRLVCGLARGSYRSLEIRYLGSRERALRPVAAAAVQGLLSEIVEPPLNLVNALHVARERGIVLQQVALGAGGTTGDYLELELQTAEGRLRVAGTLLAEDRPRISRIGDYHVDIPPRGTLLILRNRDVPGVIGKVGSVLGGAGVNIAEYHQARLEAGGEALAAIAVDGAIERAVIERLADLDEVTRVWQIDLPEADAGALGTWGAQAPALQTP